MTPPKDNAGLITGQCTGFDTLPCGTRRIFVNVPNDYAITIGESFCVTRANAESVKGEDLDALIVSLHEEINLHNAGGKGPYVKAGDISQVIHHLAKRQSLPPTSAPDAGVSEIVGPNHPYSDSDACVVRVIKEDRGWKGTCGRIGEEYAVVPNREPFKDGWHVIGTVMGLAKEDCEVIPFFTKNPATLQREHAAQSGQIAPDADMEAVREALERITLMRTMPDDKINTITLVAARHEAAQALTLLNRKEVR